MSRKLIQFGMDSVSVEPFAVNTGERLITGLAVPWNQSARNGGQQWRFERGGQRYAAVNRVKLLRDHDNTQALGKAVSIEDTDAGLMVTFRVSPGRAGDEALALAADGVLDGLSIGVEWREVDFDVDPLNPHGFVVRQYAIREVSLTAVPAFDDSRLTSVRASDRVEKEPVMTAPINPEPTPAPAPAPTPTPAPAPTPAPTPAPAPAPVEPAPSMAGGFTMTDDQFRLFMAGMPTRTEAILPTNAQAAPAVRPVVDPTTSRPTAATAVKEPLPYRFSYQPRRGAEAGKHVFHSGAEHEFSSDVHAMIDGRDRDGTAEKRVSSMIAAAFGVDTAGVAGLIPKEQRPDLWQPQMDYATPLWDMINAGTTDGTPFELPKFNSASGLVVPAVEGTEPAPGAFSVTTQTVTPTAVWGKVEITRQATRRGGNPQISAVIWDQMLRSYFEAREAAVATFLNTLTAAADIVITVPTGAADNDEKQAMAASLEAGIADLQFARGGNRFAAFAVHRDLYKVLSSVQDDSGRPLYPMMAPQNANGTTASLYRTIEIGGTTAVPSWALGATSTDPANSWLFDPAKVRGWASTPDRLNWDFGATVQSNNVTQLAYVTMGIYGDLALANIDINGVRQVIADTTGS